MTNKMTNSLYECAQSIARGLISSGKAKAPQSMWSGGFIKLFAGNDVHFWVRYDGEAVFRVVSNGDQQKQMPKAFIEEMIKEGESVQGKNIELVVRTPSPQDDPWMYDSYDTPYRPPGWISTTSAFKTDLDLKVIEHENTKSKTTEHDIPDFKELSQAMDEHCNALSSGDGETESNVVMQDGGEKWKKAVVKAQYTAKWANTMTKWLITRAHQGGPKWNIVNFVGPAGSESRGIVDLIAIRKDHANHPEPLKKGDLFEIILIQVKGGSAKWPSPSDISRLREVATRYSASAVILSSWEKGNKPDFYRLEGDEWSKSPINVEDVFGPTNKSDKKNKGDSSLKPRNKELLANI